MHRPRRASSPENDIVAQPAAASSIMRRPGRSSALVSHASFSASWTGLDSDQTQSHSPYHTRSNSQSKVHTFLDPDQQLILDSRLARIDELNEHLRESETKRIALEKQVNALQVQLDQASNHHRLLEERIQEQDEQLDEVQNEKKLLLRQCREYESIYEGEQVMLLKDKEQAKEREEHLLAVIDQLKASLSQKENSRLRSGSTHSAHTDSPDSSRLASPGSHVQGSSSSRNSGTGSSKLVLQKDRIIESLRLELAEVQRKLVEMESIGAGGRLQALEKELHEARLTNARLMEDNESYQLLLSERTLNGDFSHGDLLRPTPGGPLHIGATHSTGGGSQDGSHRPLSSSGDGRDEMVHQSTLADELQLVSSDNEGEMEDAGEEATVEAASIRELSSKINSLQDTNKALTLYINEILERILNHKSYEEILIKPKDGCRNAGLGNDGSDSSSTSDGATAANSSEASLTTSPTSTTRVSRLSGKVNGTANGPGNGPVALQAPFNGKPTGGTRLADLNKALPQRPQHSQHDDQQPQPRSPSSNHARSEPPQSIIEKTKAMVFPSSASASNLSSSPVKPPRPRTMAINESLEMAPRIPLARSVSTRLASAEQKGQPKSVNGGGSGAGGLEGILANRGASSGPGPAFPSPRNSIFSAAGSGPITGPAKRLSMTPGRNLTWSGNVSNIVLDTSTASVAPGTGREEGQPSSIDGTSSPTSSNGDSATDGQPNPSLTTMSGPIRPLRLVESNVADRSKPAAPANRTSWLTSWLGRAVSS